MAYMSFSPRHGTAEAVVEATPVDASRFTPVELRVIDFAERVDATREIPPHGRLGRFIEWALGIRLARPLADPRLESLRHFASLARHHRDRIAETDLKALVEAGHSQGQVYGLLGYLAGNNRSTDRRLAA